MKKVKRQFMYDIHAGILQSWKLYVVYAIVLIVITCSVSAECKNYISKNQYSWFDCISVFFRGIYDFSRAERTQNFRVPVEWFSFHMGCVLLGVRYPYYDYSQRGYQYLMRSGSKMIWWFSKVLWNNFHVLLYCFCFYIITLFVTVLDGGKLIWNKSDLWGIGLDNRGISFVIVVLFVMPVLVSMVLSGFGLFLSFCWNQTGAVIGVMTILIASVYWNSKFLVGNYTMICRYPFMEEKNGNILLFGIGLCIFLILFINVLGYAVFYKREEARRG
ncbi:MAG: hypothetical protein PUC12_12300 [Clostridiales bacterium]|nr:hypothetical protein [Clostridiales bacterium]